MLGRMIDSSLPPLSRDSKAPNLFYMKAEKRARHSSLNALSSKTIIMIILSVYTIKEKQQQTQLVVLELKLVEQEFILSD